ncbi:MAG TPA: methyl-accepting chemotaxis protein [Candidatus Binataceae bacterium]|nr:methyl-accepting chemotaxis protein [Candidatus Binataceae bacterium]
MKIVGLKDVTVKKKLLLLSGIFLAGLFIFAGLSYVTVNDVKIGGAAYEHVALQQRILDEYTPPDELLLEARLSVVLIALDVQDKSLDNLSADVARFKKAKASFEAGHDYWATHSPSGPEGELIAKSYSAAKNYLDLADSQYIPLVQAGKLTDAANVRKQLVAAFAEHETASKELGELAEAQVQSLEKQAASMVASRSFMLIVVALAVIGLVGVLSVVVSTGIANPLIATMKVLHQIAGGDLTPRLEIDGKDEVAQMGDALNRMADELTTTMSEINSEVQVLSSASSELSATSQQLKTSSDSTTSQANAVSAAAEQVSQNVQTVATATEEMTSSIKEIAKNASQAAEVASSAAQLAQSTNATMTMLRESSGEIGKVIKVITAIAEQTNLLALNATIEAARAGEAGKGFAVVANEVKELAKETAKATEDISTKVEKIQLDANSAVAAIDEITAVIARINDIQNTIASAVEEQTAATNEIARNIAETSKGSVEISSNITGVAQTASDTQASASGAQQAADELLRLATALSGVVEHFKIDDGSSHSKARTNRRSRTVGEAAA